MVRADEKWGEQSFGINIYRPHLEKFMEGSRRKYDSVGAYLSQLRSGNLDYILQIDEVKVTLLRSNGGVSRLRWVVLRMTVVSWWSSMVSWHHDGLSRQVTMLLWCHVGLSCYHGTMVVCYNMLSWYHGNLMTWHHGSVLRYVVLTMTIVLRWSVMVSWH